MIPERLKKSTRKHIERMEKDEQTLIAAIADRQNALEYVRAEIKRTREFLGGSE